MTPEQKKRWYVSSPPSSDVPAVRARPLRGAPPGSLQYPGNPFERSKHVQAPTSWQRRTNLWRKPTSPGQGAKRLRNRTANDGYSDEKMCPMSRETRIRCPLPQCVERPLVGSCGLLFDSLRGATPVASP